MTFNHMDYWESYNSNIVAIDISNKTPEFIFRSIDMIVECINQFYAIQPDFFSDLNKSDWFSMSKYGDELYHRMNNCLYAKDIPQLMVYKDRFRYTYISRTHQNICCIVIGKFINNVYIPTYSFFASKRDELLFKKVIGQNNEENKII